MKRPVILILLALTVALSSCASLWLAAYRHRGGGYGGGQTETHSQKH